MPKLNLQTAAQIKHSSGEVVALKGPGGILWNKPVAGGPSMSAQHFYIQDVPPAGTTQEITAVNRDRAVIMNNNSIKAGAGDIAVTSNLTSRNHGLRLDFVDDDTVNIGRASSAANNNMVSFSVWENTGVGPNQFIVRERRTVVLSASNSFSFTPPGIVNAVDVIPIITSTSTDRNGQDQDHMLAATTINRTTGEITVESRNGTGTTTVEITVVEFTGSNWTVRYGTVTNDVSDNGNINLDTSVTSWDKSLIMHQFQKGSTPGNNRAIADVNSIYEPGPALNQVRWQFDGNHDGNTDQRHTVYVLENPDWDVFRYNWAGNGLTSTNIDITSAGLVSLDQALCYISSESSGAGTAHGRGIRGCELTSLTNLRHFCHRTGNSLNIRMQVVRLPAS